MKSSHVPIDFDAAPTAAISNRIRRFDDIPDIMTMNIPPIDYLVDGIIPRKSITLWAGSDGVAKTMLVESMAVAVAVGGQFLGRICQRSPVLYLDYENPDFVVQQRFKNMTRGPVEGLKVWGTWNTDQPPQIGNELLLTMANEKKPLIIVDPFRYAHGAEENESTPMAGIMQQLRYCAAAGGAVVILHHPAKTEGSTGRGSSAIKGAVDIAFLQQLSKEDAGLITLESTKNRMGAPMIFTIRADFEACRFELCDSPNFTKRAEEILRLRQIIEAQPGVSGRGIREQWSGTTQHLLELLRTGDGTYWTSERGSRNAIRYFPRFDGTRTTDRTTEPLSASSGSGSVVLSLYRENHQNHSHHSHPEPAKQTGFRCSNCGISFDTSAGRAKHEVECTQGK